MTSRRFDRVAARDVLDRLGIPVASTTAHGIEIQRAICPGGVLSLRQTERWRLHLGGGIAGHSGQLWLAPVGGVTDPETNHEKTYPRRGPFTNRAALARALRAWRRGE